LDEVDKYVHSMNQTISQRPQFASTIGLKNKETGIIFNTESTTDQQYSVATTPLVKKNMKSFQQKTTKSKRDKVPNYMK